MQEDRRARTTFLALWLVLCLVRLVLAARVPLFVDEAFYWQESRHLAWAYSDLPGLTAWLVRLGTMVAGDHLLGVRWPFLALGAALPWLMVRTAWPLGAVRAWQAGALVSLFPLTGLLGVLALPDVPMNLAALACLLGGARALRQPDWNATAWLALGLVLGSLSHYRFLGVIGVGAVAMSWLPEGRRALREPRIWIALGIGAVAWLPLVAWNLGHGEAGWRFQLLDRHPWQLQAEGLWFPAIQAVLVTPLLLLALLAAATRISRRHPTIVRWFALCGGLTVLGFFLLGFVADTERVSFHWPLPGYLALLALAPCVLADWPRWLRRASIALLVIGLVIAIGVAGCVGSSRGRAALAGSSHYPENFAGWDVVADAVRTRLAQMPLGARLIVDHFKLGAELGFAFGDPDIAVLDHPLNHDHGRARQLAIWGLGRDGVDEDAWRLLVVGASDVKRSARLAHYQSLCRRFGALPAPQVVEADHGARQFLLFALPPGRDAGPCVTPAIMHVDAPESGSTVGHRFTLRGWAVKDVAGIDRAVVLLDGEPLTQVRYGAANTWVNEFFRGRSRDPNLPNVQFEGEVQLPGDVSPGWHVLGLELHGGDGSVERWSGPWLRVRPD